MKNLIPEDEFGVFADSKGVVRVDSLFVAAAFEKGHRHVLRDIARIIEPKSGLSENFICANFTLSTYKDARGRKLPCYLLTRDGFTMLVMGYTGPKAMHFKELYIRRFNEMEQCIQICRLHESPKPYHFSNECDMLNRIVLGMSAKQFRLANGIEKGQSIRPYLTAQQIHALERLQHLDYGLLYSCPDFQKRKQLLMAYYKTEMESCFM